MRALTPPLVGEFTLATAAAYVRRHVPFCIAFVTPGVDDADIRHTLELVAPEFHTQLVFVTADAFQFADQMLRLGLDPAHVPAVVFDDFAARPHPVAHLYGCFLFFFFFLFSSIYCLYCLFFYFFFI